METKKNETVVLRDQRLTMSTFSSHTVSISIGTQVARIQKEDVEIMALSYKYFSAILLPFLDNS